MRPFTLTQSSSHQRQPKSHHLPLLNKIAIARPTDGVTTKPLTAKVTTDAILAGAMVILLPIADKLSASIVVRRAT
jgi:hypothetical protein